VAKPTQDQITKIVQEAITSARGGEVAFCCPVHEDTNASASVNVEKGVWYCFTCQASGKVDKKAKIPSITEIIKLLSGKTPLKTYPEAWLDLFDITGPSEYWVKRYGLRVAAKHRCGTHYETGAPTYPIRQADGTLLGVVSRQEGSKAKYLYPSGIRTSATFYGTYKPSKVIVLVEGASDVMALDQSGIPQEWTVLGCFGSGLHAPQVELIQDLLPKVVVTAFDNDKAGWNAADRAVLQLKSVAPVVTHQWVDLNVNDPGDAKVSDRIVSIRKTLSESSYKKYA